MSLIMNKVNDISNCEKKMTLAVTATMLRWFNQGTSQVLPEKVQLLTFDPLCPSVIVTWSFRLTVQFLRVCPSLICPTQTRCSASCLQPEPQHQPRQEPAGDYMQPRYSAQVLAMKEMEEAISSTEALALQQSVFPRAWQCSSQHFPHPSSSVRYNSTNERSDFSPDRLS